MKFSIKDFFSKCDQTLTIFTKRSILDVAAVLDPPLALSIL